MSAYTLELPHVILKPGDVGNTAGDTPLGYAIRKFSTTKGEEPSEVNHSFIVVRGGALPAVVIVEALSKVRRHGLVENYGPKGATRVEIWRAAWLTDKERDAVAWYALGFVNRSYGYHKIAANALDRLLFGGRAKIRRLFSGEAQPICSHLVAASFKAGARYSFGDEPETIQPDDIADHVRKHEHDRQQPWELVFPLAPLKDWKRWEQAAHREV